MGRVMKMTAWLAIACAAGVAAPLARGDENEPTDWGALVSGAASISAREHALLATASPPPLAQFAQRPLTLVVLTARTPLRGKDLRIHAGVLRSQLLDAIHPWTERGDRRVRRHPRPSLVLPEYITRTDAQVEGDVAQGVVHFAAPDVYEGRVRFRAQRSAGTWQVVELVVASESLRVRSVGGRWQLVAQQSERPSRPPRCVVPTVSHGEITPPLSDRFEIWVMDDGLVRLVGRAEPVSLRELEAWIADRTRDATDADGSVRLHALLKVDTTIPWAACRWLLRTLASASVHKVHFAVLGPQGTVGVLSSTLVEDDIAEGRSAAPAARIRLSPSQDGQSADLNRLYELLRARPAGASAQQAVRRYDLLVPAAHGDTVPFGYMLKVVDVVMRAGGTEVAFAGGPPPPEGVLVDDAQALAARIRELQAQRVAFGITVDETRVPGAAGRSWPRIGVQGGTAHVTARLLPSMPTDDPWGSGEGLSDGPFEGPLDSGVIGVGGEAGDGTNAFPGRRLGLDGGTAAETRPVDEAVAEGLSWLAAHQSAHGGWEARDFGAWCNGERVAAGEPRPDGQGKALFDVGVTGLALSAFLSAGYTHLGQHPYAHVVARGLRYLLGLQDARGCFGARAEPQFVYNHALAALAMVEAYGMTGSELFRRSAQRALDFVAAARNPFFAWRYGIKSGDNDTSISAWMALVLQSAMRVNEAAAKRDAPPPLQIDEKAADGFRSWLGKVMDVKTGRAGYIQRGTGSVRAPGMAKQFPSERTAALTAATLATRVLFLGEDPRASAVLRRGAKRIERLRPVWNPVNGSIDMYYWHWGSLAAFQAGGKTWNVWRRALSRAVVDTQRRDSTPCLFRGSWDPVGAWGGEGGRVYATAILTLALQAAHRYERRFEPR